MGQGPQIYVYTFKNTIFSIRLFPIRLCYSTEFHRKIRRQILSVNQKVHLRWNSQYKYKDYKNWLFHNLLSSVGCFFHSFSENICWKQSVIFFPLTNFSVGYIGELHSYPMSPTLDKKLLARQEVLSHQLFLKLLLLLLVIYLHLFSGEIYLFISAETVSQASLFPRACL